MKVLLFDFGDYATPHMETEADILQQHLDRGDEVIRLGCNRELPVCRQNREHNLAICTICVCKRNAAWSLVRPRVPHRPLLNLTEQDRQTIAAFSYNGERLSELKRLTFGPFDLGLAVAAVLVDETKDPDPNLRQHRQLVRDWIGVALAAYLSTLNTLEQERPDRVYVMNGRWAYNRAVLHACQGKGVECCLHERGGDLARYLITVNRLPHEIQGTARSIEEMWQCADPASREAIGSSFFQEKAGGIERQWFSFVADQEAGLLPHSWDPTRRNIGVFMTSEFEFAAIGPEYNYPFYHDQNEGLARIAAALEQAGAPVHLQIRVHPNLKGIRNANLDWVLQFRHPNVTVVPSESPVSSYALLRNCEKVLTFGSTMGIEAVYWGKPSILAGRSTYQHLGATYNPTCHEELVQMLLADLPPKPTEGALKYGYYVLSQGLAHVHYRADTPWKGRLKGKYVDDVIPWFWRPLVRLARVRALRWLGPIVRLSRWHQEKMRRRIGLPTLDVSDMVRSRDDCSPASGGMTTSVRPEFAPSE